MAHLIDKDALVAEIERRKNEEVDYDEDSKNFASYADHIHYSTLDSMEDFINTLEMKEVDLEKELESWRHNHFNGKRDKEAVGEYLKRVSQLDLAKHFFELALRAIKDNKL